MTEKTFSITLVRARTIKLFGRLRSRSTNSMFERQNLDSPRTTRRGFFWLESGGNCMGAIPFLTPAPPPRRIWDLDLHLTSGTNFPVPEISCAALRQVSLQTFLHRGQSTLESDCSTRHVSHALTFSQPSGSSVLTSETWLIDQLLWTKCCSSFLKGHFSPALVERGTKSFFCAMNLQDDKTGLSIQNIWSLFQSVPRSRLQILQVIDMPDTSVHQSSQSVWQKT